MPKVDFEEMKKFSGWAERVMQKIAPEIVVEPEKKGSCFSGRTNEYKV
jgi:hypothetical protein